LPERPGVYVIVLKNERICRFKGESDILYIGSATGKRGLKNRFSYYRNPHESQTTNIKINNFIIKSEPNITIFWKVIENEDPRKEEEELLRKYFKEHDELPPLNDSNARRIKI